MKERKYIRKKIGAVKIGIGLGFLVCLVGIVLFANDLGSIFADTPATITKNTDTHFDQGTNSDTQVTGSGTGAYIELAGTTGPDGTLYKRSITVDNTGYGSELTNYQVLVSFDSETLISAGKMQSDCDDIRFLDSDDSTELDYWIEGGCNSDTTEVWVEVPTIPASSTDTIYLYYGSDAATSDSNGDETFVFFDDFDDNDVSDWSSGALGGTIVDFSGSGGKMHIDVNSNWYAFWNTEPGTLTDYEQEYTVTASAFDTSHQLLANGGRITSNTALYMVGRWSNNYRQYHRVGSTWTLLDTVSSAPSNVLSTEYSYKIQFLGTTFRHKIWENSSSEPGSWQQSTTDSTYANGYPGLLHYPGIIDVDDFRVRNLVSTEPSVSLGSEELILPASGTWTSPSDSNVIDLAWNGGWGDGSTGSSTAFAATVANVTSNATITFKIRVAATAGGLSSEAWSTIGTINTGTSFTADKDTMDALALDTGTDGRYVQIAADFAQTDGNNPQIDSFALTYSSDDTAPETNASSLTMRKAAGGNSVADGGWTNGSSPYFSWTQGVDSQADIKGYCLYLGTDSAGNPATSKGLLGTSPVSTSGTTCQFIVSGTNVDFATQSYQGVTWLSSSTDAYYLNVKAVDNAGNVFSGSSAQFSFKFDNTKPTNPSFVSMPSDFIATKSATLIWPTTGGDQASDSHSGVAGLQYRIGSGGTWYGDNHTGDQDADDLLTNDGSYTIVQSPDFSTIQEGNNLIYLRTWDTAGNYSTTYVNGVLKVNTVAPGVPQSLAVTPSTATTNSYAFTWDAPSTFTGQESNITYCYTVNTAPTANTCTYTSAGQTSLSAGAYATQPGTNTMYIVARDEASNVNYATYASVEFSYTGTAPGIPRNLDIADISIKASSSWKLAVSWDAPSDVGAGVESYKIFRSTSATSCSSSFGSFTEVGTTAGTSYTDTGLSQTDYYYCVKACDSANNCGAVSSTVTAYPDGKFTTSAGLTSGPTVTGITTKKATVTWSTDRTSDSKVAYGKSSGNYNSEEVSNSTQTTSHTINLTSLDAGTTYYYKAKWTDEDGNTGLSDEKSFTTDPAPTVSEVEATEIGISSVLLSFKVSGASKAKIYYGPTTTFGGLAEVTTSTTESTYTVQLTGLEDGTKYFYKINTFDTEEEEYENQINDFTTLPRPEVTNVRIQEVPQAANPTVLVTWTSNTDVSSIVTYYPEGNPAAAQDVVDVARVSGTHRMLVRGLLPNRRYVLIAKGVDKAGNEAVSDTQTFTTSTDTRPPLISELNIEGNVQVVQETQENKSVQLIVSWNTDEPSTSQVEFGEGTGSSYSQQTQEDKNLTLNHVVIISGLQPRSVYHLRAISKDEAGNVGKSIDTVTIAPKVTDDALDLVLSNLRETFGFLDAFVSNN